MNRAPLNRERVLEAALELVDREGLDSLSMRRVATGLKVEAMSLYNHVDGKDALLDGLYERVLARLPPPSDRALAWPERLKERALALRAALLAHPHCLPLFVNRPAVSTQSLREVEAVLQVLHDAGFSTLEALSALQCVVAFVVGHCMATAAPVEDTTRVDYARLSSDEFQRLRAVALELEQHDPEREFRRGLDWFLAGMEAQRQPQRRRSSTR